jgi:hypothetical protein
MKGIARMVLKLEFSCVVTFLSLAAWGEWFCMIAVAERKPRPAIGIVDRNFLSIINTVAL